MRKPLTCICLLIAVIYACNQSGISTKAANSLLQTTELPSEYFSIDINRDTTVFTKRGAIIHVPAGAIRSNKPDIKLEVKEAYSMEEIISAGLTTQSNGQTLSSGGMIYINPAAGEDAKLTGTLSVATPTEFIRDGMQLYKGEMDETGRINWSDTTPLAENAQSDAVKKGEILFINQCATCHSIDKKLTVGPSLAHMDKFRWENYESDADSTRSDISIMDRFIINNAEVIEHDHYYKCLYERYNKSPMPVYADLTMEDLDNLFAYVGNESNRLGIPLYENPRLTYLKCRDSCWAYALKKGEIIERREKLIEENGPLLVRDIRLGGFGSFRSGNLIDPAISPPNKVVPANFPAKYYQFKISVFGWYNIDMLVGEIPGMLDSKLSVEVTEKSDASFNIFLVIPQYKIYQEGGLLKGEKNKYGFDDISGNAPLPQGAVAWVFAMGEGDDEILFAKTSFVISRSQELQLPLRKIGKGQFRREIRSMSLDSIDVKVGGTKNADEIRKADKELKKVEVLKPKNCDCGCGEFGEEGTASEYREMVQKFRKSPDVP